jgi:hypothetical protein
LQLLAHPGVQFTAAVEAIISSAALTQQPIPLVFAAPVPGYPTLRRSLLRPLAQLVARFIGEVEAVTAMPVSASISEMAPVPFAMPARLPDYPPSAQAELRPSARLELQNTLAGKAASNAAARPLSVTPLASRSLPRPEPLAFAIHAAGFERRARALLRPPAPPETPFAGAIHSAMRPASLSETMQASLATPRLEPLTLATSVPGFASAGRALLRPAAHPETSFAAAKPLQISLPDAERTIPAEDFLQHQMSPVEPSVVSGNSFRIQVSDTARMAMTLPAIAVPASASRQIPPIPSTWAVETPVSGCAPPALGLWYALAFLEPRGVGPAGRNLVSGPRELPQRSRRAPAVRLAARAGSVRTAHPSGTWELAAIGQDLACVRVGSMRVTWMGVTWISSTEDIHPMEVRVRAPGMPAQPELLLAGESFASLSLGVQDQPREHPWTLGLPEIQRFRAAALIQIREPQLRNSAPSDLPIPSTNLPWLGVGMVSAVPPAAIPVPLRPPLQNPRVL